MESHRKLLLANRAWAKEKSELRPGFFRSLLEGQQPEFLWLGCSDSRVPAEEITGSQPGDIFVHRNVANCVHGDDLNMLSVVQYAVEVLKTRHVIICGHYNCGGVMAAISGQMPGRLAQWLKGTRDAYMKNEAELSKLSEGDRLKKMVEINVKDQILNLSKTDIIQNAWKNGPFPILHGWVFSLEDGLIRDVIGVGPESTHSKN